MPESSSTIFNLILPHKNSPKPQTARQIVTLIKSQIQQKPYINPGGDNGRQSNASDPRATTRLRPQQQLLLKKKKCGREERQWRQYIRKKHTMGRSSSAPNENNP
jgi:hypothetical protein